MWREVRELVRETFGSSWLISPCTKLPPFWQTTISNAFSWMKMIEFWFEFHWKLFPGVRLTINQHWSRWWLDSEQATSHCLNWCWLSSQMHICCTKWKWVTETIAFAQGTDSLLRVLVGCWVEFHATSLSHKWCRRRNRVHFMLNFSLELLYVLFQVCSDSLSIHVHTHFISANKFVCWIQDLLPSTLVPFSQKPLCFNSPGAIFLYWCIFTGGQFWSGIVFVSVSVSSTSLYAQ